MLCLWRRERRQCYGIPNAFFSSVAKQSLSAVCWSHKQLFWCFQACTLFCAPLKRKWLFTGTCNCFPLKKKKQLHDKIPIFIIENYKIQISIALNSHPQSTSQASPPFNTLPSFPICQVLCWNSSRDHWSQINICLIILGRDSRGIRNVCEGGRCWKRVKSWMCRHVPGWGIQS